MSKKPVILYADDDENAQVLLKRAFLKAGVDATVAMVSDGDEAIRYLSKDAAVPSGNPVPDLLLLDLKMPKKNGFDVLEHIRNSPEFQSFPVVVFSSSYDECDVRKAYRLGCHSYVSKPVDFKRLVELAGAMAAEFFPNSPRGENHPISFSRFTIQSRDSVHPTTALSAQGAYSKMSASVPSAPPELFQLLVEQVKDYAIFMLDPQGYVLSWNEGVRRIKGYEQHELIGKHFSIFYPQPDKDRQKPEFELTKAKEMGRYEDEGWRVRKDGSRFWANVVITPLYAPDGRLLGYGKVTRDLTQRKLQEESIQRLIESEERFRLLVEQVKDYAIFLLDAKGKIATWNQGAARLKGYTADEILGKHFSIFYPPEDIARDHPTHELSIAIRDGRYEEEGWRVRKDGSRFWASIVITSLWDKRGNLTGFAKVTRDLTEQKKESDALRLKSDELESFAHTLSHDLRSPLRSISGFAEILLSEVNEMPRPEIANYAEKITRAAHRMNVLIEDILRLSAMNLSPISREPISLEEVFSECVESLQADIDKTGAQVEIQKPLPVVNANHTVLVQLFSNLLSNAIKFTPKGRSPRVEIYARKMDGHCEIHVKDHGIGIPESLHQSIFNAFERGNATSEFDGTGIGLAVVRKAVARLGGKIHLKSKEGEGSDFAVTLSCEMPEKTVALDKN